MVEASTRMTPPADIGETAMGQRDGRRESLELQGHATNVESLEIEERGGIRAG